MARYKAAFTDRILEEMKKLDRRQRQLVYKRIGKILEMPELGKPLHAPLNNYKSERMEKHRIVYKVVGSTVVFAWLEHRKHVYE